MKTGRTYWMMMMAVCLPVTMKAQQKAQFTQYMFNQHILNPAYAGVDEALRITFVNRNQWIRTTGAPVTQTLSCNTLLKKHRTGLGMIIVNDKVGVHKNTTIMAGSSYHLKLNNDTYLSMGLQAGINKKNSDYTQLSGSMHDPSINQSHSKTYFNIGTGFYLRTPSWHIGVSVPEIFPGTLHLNNTTALKLNRTHWYLFSKYSYALNDNINIEPSVLLKYLEGIPLSYDANLCVEIHQVLTVGFSYRKKESIDFIWKSRVTPQLEIGYSYDHTLGEISLIGSGSHELMMNYLFKFSKSNITSPR